MPRQLRRRALFVCLLLIAVVTLPAAADWGHITAEWSLAFGRDRAVVATVAGQTPVATMNRACPDEMRIDTTWTGAPAPGAGSFRVCRDEAAHYPVGDRVKVEVQPHDRSLIFGEGPADAIFGVVLESLVLAGLLWVVLALLNTVVTLRPGRWKGATGEPCTVWRADKPGFWRLVRDDTAAATRIKVLSGTGRLTEGEQVTAVAVGRTLLRRRPTGPYLLRRRASDPYLSGFDSPAIWANGFRMRRPSGGS